MDNNTGDHLFRTPAQAAFPTNHASAKPPCPERFSKAPASLPVGIILSTLLVWAIFSACTKQDDDKQIRALITRAAALAEDHDISGLLDLTAENVRAMPMELNRSGIRGMLWRAFKYYGPLSILYPRPDIEIRDDIDSASARFPFLILKATQTIPDLEKLSDDPQAWIDAIGEIADLYRLRLDLTRQDGRWLVKHAVLERFTGMGFKAEQ